MFYQKLPLFHLSLQTREDNTSVSQLEEEMSVSNISNIM